MNKKTIMLIAWPLSVLVTGWLSCIAGAQFGTYFGRADYHANNVRPLYNDLREAAKSSDQRTREVLDAVSEVVAAMGDPAYEIAREHFATKIKDMQKPHLPTGKNPTTSNPNHLSRPAAE